MNKFNIRICKCGKIHAIPREKVIDACYTGDKNNKDIAIICGSCGNIVIIGADYVPSYECDGTMGYDCYTKSFNNNNNAIINIKNYKFEKPTEILYVQGYKVPMMNGEYANYYSHYGTGFEDMTYPDFMKIEGYDTTMEDVRKWLQKYRTDRKTVDMNRLIAELPEEICESLSGYLIEGLNWTGTKYDKF